MAGEDTTQPTTPAKRASFFQRLYVGNGALDVVGKRKRLYIFFSALVLVCLASIVFRGFNFGIDFEGGTKIQLDADGANGTISTKQVDQVYQDTLGSLPESTQSVGVGDTASIQIRTETLNQNEIARLKAALTSQLKPNGAVSDSAVSGTWGGEVTQQALIALVVFLVLVTIFLALYFERRMAIAALITLFHDVIVTAGIYSLIGFEVTPATAIGLLTILGFSLYDTVVVFDKVKENTRGLLGLTRRTYGEAANLAVNQTLMRSINTALIALLPVIGLFVVGAVLLGVGTLQDLALVQIAGMVAGVVSSIALATPLLVDFTMRDPKFKAQAKRVRARRASIAAKAAGAEGAVVSEKPETFDEESLASELRKERALSAAGGVPARNPSAAEQRRRQGQPQGKRPSGKRKH
ncbi:protein translocase subunit SecF [Kibdelosporangium phytohabitans]|uniref:Protein-export membrane protein SecF n=1 Tax=Kibdelosporangium phytohabitans TaxID=860235 RepID=A0A0N9IB62_9PSEU|nr:protein translocase subunit SecF [Kibdelosporangium phytohabitans]ALG11728.1 preprotein translocase subunit SecF [Kibdelosporangium phytohabitans]MBE1463129.1 preprotein translocase subunit SecF [Kibdelosporangium phytohabitans]